MRNGEDEMNICLPPVIDVRIVLHDIPEYVFKACGATTQDERDTISACVRVYARDCIHATLLTIGDRNHDKGMEPQSCNGSS